MMCAFLHHMKNGSKALFAFTAQVWDKIHRKGEWCYWVNQQKLVSSFLRTYWILAAGHSRSQLSMWQYESRNLSSELRRWRSEEAFGNCTGIKVGIPANLSNGSSALCSQPPVQVPGEGLVLQKARFKGAAESQAPSISPITSYCSDKSLVQKFQ